MSKLTPRTALALVVGFAALVLGIEVVSGSHGHRFERIRPDPDGVVRIDVGEFENLDVQFYRFLNAGNQEVEFLVGRDRHGEIQVGFNSNDNHAKTRRGFSYQDGWIIDNKCETTTRLSAINQGGGGCKPTAVDHRVEGDELVLLESDILKGWRYFR